VVRLQRQLDEFAGVAGTQEIRPFLITQPADNVHYSRSHFGLKWMVRDDAHVEVWLLGNAKPNKKRPNDVTNLIHL